MSKIPYWIYLLSHYFYKFKISVIPQIIVFINRIIWGAYIPASCVIGKGTRFGYGGSGVVIHARVVIGKNCNIGPCVIIGGRSKIYQVPVIGDNVFVGGGAKVLGDVNIGNLSKPLINQEEIKKIYNEKYTMDICAKNYLSLYKQRQLEDNK